MYKQYKYKDQYRFALYMIAGIFILYFFFSSYSICNDLSEKELNMIDTKPVIDFNYNYLEDSTKVIDLNDTYGGQIWKLFKNLVQIIFLVFFMLYLYVNELLDKWSLKR